MWEGEDCEAVLQLLSANRGRLLSCKKVSRALDRQRFKEDALWARNDLRKLQEHGLIEQDNGGLFFVPKEEH